MAAVLCVKAASDFPVRFFLSILDAWGRSEIKVVLRADQEVAVTSILREVQARRRQSALLERSPVESLATMGAMDGANRILGEMLRSMKHAAKTRIGGREWRHTPRRTCEAAWAHGRQSRDESDTRERKQREATRVMRWNRWTHSRRQSTELPWA